MTDGRAADGEDTTDGGGVDGGATDRVASDNGVSDSGTADAGAVDGSAVDGSRVGTTATDNGAADADTTDTDTAGAGVSGDRGADADAADTGATWVVVIPVKPTAIGKSRLVDARSDRAALARAIALDTIAAAAATEMVAEVIVVTDDDGVAAEAGGVDRVRVIPEGTQRGLNPAIATGMAAAGDAVHRAALLGDLPALHPADLATALVAASSVDRAVVADAEGVGSTLVTARAAVAWSSAFGEDSFARHVALGFVPLEIADAPTLRRDVDTIAQLDQARTLGVGSRTARLQR